VAYDAPGAPRKILKASGAIEVRSTGHAHVKGRFPADIDND
jgi:hypothetical protein